MEHIARHPNSLTESVNWVFFASNAKPTSMRRAIAERLAETNSVVIVDHPVSVLRDRQTPSFVRRRERLCESTDSWRYTPLHFPEQLAGIGIAVRLFNQCLLQRELNRLMPRGKPRVVCYDAPSQYHLVKRLLGDISIYVAIDDLTLTVSGVPIKGELHAEKKLLESVDKVICVSETLAETLRSRMPSHVFKPVYALGNAYDERVFDSKRNYPEPAVLKGIPKPRILVSGHISAGRIDWDGIRQASLIRPEWTWVFLGPTDPGIKDKISHDLAERGVWHPQIALSEIPACIHHSDACAVPYRLNGFTLSSYPLKAIEYLAMGVPLLSTRVPSLKRYGDTILWIDEGDGAGYAEALDRCLTIETEPSRRESRRQAVSKDAWGVRVNQFTEAVLNGHP